MFVTVGYAIPWGWTGFTGNTLWDWLHLLLLPLLLPTVIVPRLAPKMKATLIVVEEDKPAQAGPAPPEPAEPALPARPESTDPAQRVRGESLDHVE